MCVLFMILQLYNRSFIERLDTQLSKNLIQFIFWNKGTPQDPYLKRNGQINRLTKVSNTFRPTESDSEKNGWLS